jgi:hypothetical protein
MYGVPQPEPTNRFGATLEHWRPMSEQPTSETAPFGVWLGRHGGAHSGNTVVFARIPLSPHQMIAWECWQAVSGPVGDVPEPAPKLPKLPDGFCYVQEPYDEKWLAIVSSPSMPEPTSSDNYVRYDSLGVLRVVLQAQHASLLTELVDALNEANELH